MRARQRSYSGMDTILVNRSSADVHQIYQQYEALHGRGSFIRDLNRFVRSIPGHEGQPQRRPGRPATPTGTDTRQGSMMPVFRLSSGSFMKRALSPSPPPIDNNGSGTGEVSFPGAGLTNP